MSEPVWVPLGGSQATRRERIPIRLRVPRSSTLAGNSAYSVTALTAHDFAVWEFVNNVEGRIYGYVTLPLSFATTPTPTIWLTLASGVASGNMRFRVSTKCVVDGQSFNPAAFTAESYQNIPSGGIWIRKDAAYPIQEPLVPRGLLLVEITRDGANAVDTAEGVAYLIEAYLEIDLGA